MTKVRYLVFITFLVATGVALSLWWFRPREQAACQALSIQLTHVNLTMEEPASSTDAYWGQALQVSAAPDVLYQNTSWRVEGPATQDYDERVSDGFENAGGWKVLPNLPEVVTDQSFRLYFLPTSPNETAVRKISLEAKLKDGVVCKCSVSVKLKPYLRPAELYTSDHRDPAEKNLHKGRVIDAHFVWHMFSMLGEVQIHQHPSFFHFHHLFVARYQSWRKMFKYPESAEWKPGDLIVKPEEDLFLHDAGHKPQVVTWNPPAFLKFTDYQSDMFNAHNVVHQQVQPCNGEFGCFLGMSSPKSELFWRFHVYLDGIYQKRCLQEPKPEYCPTTGDN